VNPGVILDQRLRPVAVMDIPVDYQHAIDNAATARVSSSQRNVPREAKSHRLVAKRMVTRRTDRAEAPDVPTVERHIDGIQYAAHGGRRRGPRAGTDDSVFIRVNQPAQRARFPEPLDIVAAVQQAQILFADRSALEVGDGVKKIRVFSQRARNCPQPPYVFRVSPSRIVATTVRVRYQGGGQSVSTATPRPR
jgi:hypothetical protein